LRLLLLADLHLDAALSEWGDRRDTRRREIEAALADAVDGALDPKDGVHAVLVAGDLFDRPDPSEETVAFAWSQLTRFAPANIPVIIVPGYYDPAAPGSVYLREDLPPSVTVVDWPELKRVEIPTADGPLQLYSFCWTPGITPPDPWAAFSRDPDAPGPHVGLFHADLRVEGDPDSSSPAPAIDSKILESCGVDLVHLGRAHEYGEFEIGETTAVYPGTPVGLGIGEWGDRFLVTAEFTRRGLKIRTRIREGAPVISEDVGVTPEMSTAEVAGLVRTRCEEAALARIRLHGEVSTPLDADAILAAMGPVGAVVDLVDETDLAPVTVATEDEDAAPVRALFEQRLQARISNADDPEERELLRRALRIGADHFRRQEAGHAR